MSPRTLPLRVTSAEQAAAFDRAAIAAGTASFELMLRAGTRSAELILRELSDRLEYGVAVFAGRGNNGGDAYILAAQLARAGIAVHCVAAGSPNTDDARRAQGLAAARGVEITSQCDLPHTATARVVVDGLLGTGHRGEFRPDLLPFVQSLSAARARGASVVALDIPSGLNATSGECADGVVAADITTTFGTVKRGLLSARQLTGRLVLVDIGLPADLAPSEAWLLADHHLAHAFVPSMAWNAHKGTRGKLLIVGGHVGMAGATILAGQGALHAGAGLVQACVDTESLSAVQHELPQAIASAWSALDVIAQSTANVHASVHANEQTNVHANVRACVIGPGLGTTERSERAMLAALSSCANTPTLLDADALNLVARDGGNVAERLRAWVADRACVITPHPGEFHRLAGLDARAPWFVRIESAIEFARASGTTIVVKGTPAAVVAATATETRVVVVPRGSAVLATGGSGDVLSGIIGGLLAQRLPAFDAAVGGVFAHGLAGELATTLAGTTLDTPRGASLSHVLAALPQAWRDIAHPPSMPPGVVASWPALV